MTKSEQIKISLQETREKRQSQLCRVFTVKVDEKSLRSKQREQLKMLFVEAKRFYNHILNWSENEENDIFKFSRKDCKEVEVLDKNRNRVVLPLEYLTSSLKDSVHQQICSSIKAISKLKKLGYQKNGGRLKYISECKSLNFKQNELTHKIKNNHKIKLQGVSKDIRVNGLEQFINEEGIEIANLKLLNNPKGYYIAITTFIDKDKIKSQKPFKEEIGIDFGCSNTLNLSTGDKINVVVEETDRLKRLQRKLQKKQKGSNNYYKTRSLLEREYQYLTNIKNDVANKIVAYLKQHQLIVIQDEQLQNWQKTGHGKTVSHSVLGRIKAKLKDKRNQNVVVLDKFIPTTKFCSICGKTHEVSQYDKTVTCCGVTEDRDIHSAKNMLWIAKNLFNSQIRLGQSEFKRAEFCKQLESYFSKDCETRSCSIFS